MRKLAITDQAGHTLLELMIAIIVGLFLVLGAFSVLAAFEGHKRSTTAVNDAMQSGNYGLYTIDKLVRSAGTGMARFASKGAYGCGLNYVPVDSLGNTGSTVNSAGLPALPDPFTTTLSGPGVSALRLTPAIVFPGITSAEGTVGGVGAKSDVLMVMLGAAGYGEAPIPITQANGPTVDSTVGFTVGDWVLVADKTGLGNCMLTHVASGFPGPSADNVVLPLQDASVGSAAGLIAANNVVVGLGSPKAATFMMYAVGNTGTNFANSLVGLDLLNSTMAAAQRVTDDIVLLRAVYGVDPTNSGTLKWVNPAAVTIAGTPYTYTPKALLAGDAAANTALQTIRAVRISMIVRAPLAEKDATNLNKGTYTLFESLDNTYGVRVPWTVPVDHFRYRQIETSVPIRNGLF